MLVQQEKQAAFGLLAAGIAHEVGNPLASISSIVQLMSRKNTDSAVGERLQLVDGQLQRIQRILKELTRFSRPANEQLASADVHSAINDALNIAKYYGRWKGKTVVTSFAEGLPQIRTVHDQLVQVMLNLIPECPGCNGGGRIDRNLDAAAGSGVRATGATGNSHPG